MALADATSVASARVIRGRSTDLVGDHAFAAIGDLPRVAASRPHQTGNRALDAIRTAAWDEGYAAGRTQGADAGYTDGFDRGVVEGQEAGYREGRATARNEAMELIEARVGAGLDALEHAARELDAREAVTLAQIEEMVIDLALTVAGTILDREVATASDPGREALVRALALAPDHETYLARLHPADLEAIAAVTDLTPGRTLDLVADPSITPGGCVVEAGSARIDARIETALARVREALRS